MSFAIPPQFLRITLASGGSLAPPLSGQLAGNYCEADEHDCEGMTPPQWAFKVAARHPKTCWDAELRCY